MSHAPQLFKTIEEAKEFLRENLDEGAECPCCTQTVKAYKYNLFATSAAALIRLMKIQDKNNLDHVHISEFAEAGKGYGRASHFAELRHWGLVQPMDKKTSEANSSGMWTITEKGRVFATNGLKVQQKVRLFNNTLLGFEGDHIGITDALGNKFDYKSLMM